MANLTFEPVEARQAVSFPSVPRPVPRDQALHSMLAARSLYLENLEAQIPLQGIGFPFATATPSMGSVEQLASEARLDTRRFGTGQPSLRSSFASVMQPGVTAKFASFRLEPATTSWRRLAESARPQASSAADTGPFGIPTDQNADGIDDTSFFERAIGLEYLEARRRIEGPAVLVAALSTTGGGERPEKDVPAFEAGTRPLGYAPQEGDAVAALPSNAALEAAEEEAFFAPRPPGPKRETVADTITRSAMTSGLSRPLTGELLQLLSSEFDFETPVGASDRLEIFFSEPGDGSRATDASRIHFVRATFGGTYRTFYRFEGEDGTAAYFGPEGRSSRQFLLRSPVPSGVFSSGFGLRRHPILGYERMHSGVDWSAPSGTPIFATASGTVLSAGPKGGYGLQTVLRHEDGYETSYSHQSRIADGVEPGAYLGQGKVIGFVGATGLATGAHIHYEVRRDGAEMDPMEVRSPDRGPTLRGMQLDAFLAERDRIDDLVYRQQAAALTVASAGGE